MFPIFLALAVLVNKIRYSVERGSRILVFTMRSTSIADWGLNLGFTEDVIWMAPCVVFLKPGSFRASSQMCKLLMPSVLMH